MREAAGYGHTKISRENFPTESDLLTGVDSFSAPHSHPSSPSPQKIPGKNLDPCVILKAMRHARKSPESLLREAIRLAIHEETIKAGDLRAALDAAKKKQNIEKAKAAAKEAGKKGVMAALGLIPGAGTLVGAIEAGMELKDLYDAAKDIDPETKKKNPLWDLLTIDPDTSAIVDDAVEAEFVSSLGDRVKYLDDDDDLPDADTQLASYLKGKFDGSHVKK